MCDKNDCDLCDALFIKIKEPVVFKALEWTDEEVIALNDSMYADGRFILPIGVNKHFNMMAIQKRFETSIKKKVETAVLWKRLEENYDLDKLDTVVNCPFPNDETEFSLPKEFSQLILDREGESGSQDSDEPEESEQSEDDGSQPNSTSTSESDGFSKCL